MSAFTDAWLGAREPVDHAARSRPLALAFAAAVGEAPRLVDLGCGTGSNLRYLAPLLPVRQHWELVDNDPALLRAASSRLEAWGRRGDLQAERTDHELSLEGHGRRIEVAFAERDIADLHSLLDRRPSGITAAALLDLTSADWLDALARRVAERPLPLLFALSFDGRLTFEPPLDEDERVRRCFVRHQRTDKGFGPALGPDAVGHLAHRLEAAGRRVELAASDWYLDETVPELGAMFLAGIGQVLNDLGAEVELASWIALRRAQLDEGALRIRVGHRDLFAE